MLVGLNGTSVGSGVLKESNYTISVDPTVGWKRLYPRQLHV